MLGISDTASAMIPGRNQSSSIIPKGLGSRNRDEIDDLWPLQRPRILEQYVQIFTQSMWAYWLRPLQYALWSMAHCCGQWAIPCRNHRFGSLRSKSSAEPTGSVLIANIEQTQLDRQWTDRAAHGTYCEAVKLTGFAYVTRMCSLKRGFVDVETYHYPSGGLILDQSLLVVCWLAEVAAVCTSRSCPVKGYVGRPKRNAVPTCVCQ